MAVDFKSLLGKPMDSAERPPVLPSGTYYGIVTNYTFDVSKGENRTPYVRYDVQLREAGDDVDQSQLSTKDGKPIDLARRNLRKDFYLTDDARWRLRKFLESCNISTTGRTDGECIADSKNVRVMVALTQRPGQRDPEEIFNEISDMKGDPR